MTMATTLSEAKRSSIRSETNRARPPQGKVPFLGYGVWPLALVVCAGLGAFAWFFPRVVAAAGITRMTPRFDPAPILTAPWVIQAHVTGAVTALLVGLVILAQRKGGTRHRTLGWIWVIAMALTAISSIFIPASEEARFSWIHGLSTWVLLATPIGLAAIRFRNVRRHARWMTMLFISGLFIAGLFTFMPGRRMFEVFFSV